MNRFATQFQRTLEKEVVTIFCNCLGTGASVPTLLRFSWGGTGGTLATAGSGTAHGVKSITRNGAGDYTFTFMDNFIRLLDVSCSVLSIDGSTTPLVASCWTKAVNTAASGGATVRLIFYLSTPATPADAGSNERIYLAFQFSNSSAPC